jgi:hypothetical protein
VKIVRTLKHYVFCVEQTGTIRKIMKDGKVHLCIEPNDPAIKERVKQTNARFGTGYQWFTDHTLLRCQVSHIEKI